MPVVQSQSGKEAVTERTYGCPPSSPSLIGANLRVMERMERKPRGVGRAGWAAAGLSAALFSLLGSSSSAEARSPGKLSVAVSNVRNSQGAVFIAVYDGAHWLKPGQFQAHRRVRARQGTVSVSFDGMEPGRYAIAVFHDENDNGRVDTNFLGLPAEGFGFSKLSPFRKPAFEETSFVVDGHVSMGVRLRY